MARLAISLLSTLHVTRNAEPITNFATDKARALLAYLAVEAGRPHRRDTLAGLLWPDQPQKKARQNLRQALSDLRKAIADCDESPFLLVSRESIQFNPACDYDLDVAVFTNLAKTCETHRHRRLEACLPCLRRLERMVHLYRGAFLEQFFLSDSEAFEEWAVLKREWLQGRATEALSLLADYYEQHSNYRQAQQHARRQVQLEPWREEAHRQLMRLLALDGQRSAALAQYETCRRALADELGIEPTAETTALYKAIHAAGQGDASAANSLPGLPRSSAPPHNLPASVTVFVGREQELTDLAEHLSNPDCRLVTLFGPGGIGKTRLALQAATDHLGLFADGIAFVPLAGVDVAEHLVPAIAGALGVPFHGERDPTQQLLDYFSRKEMLLVLDNMEHLLAGADFLSTLLQRAPDVVLLVTSRERLNMPEEWLYEIEGLPYPEQETGEIQPGYSAIDLFRQRALQADRRVACSPAELPHIGHICRLVEGMPLGIELAASWATATSCERIAQKLASNLDLLTTRLRNVPERHRSLWATFEHSFQLLIEEEKSAFTGLSVFRGGFSREAAKAVIGATTPLLTTLQDKSLIRRVSPDRYSMHEMLRHYAFDKLKSTLPLFESIRARHTRYFTSFLSQRESLLQGEGQKQALQDIDNDIGNVRQAWQVAVTQGWAEFVAQSLESLYYFYTIRCRFQEGIALFALAIDRWREEEEQEALVGRALAYQGALYRRLDDYDLAREVLQQSSVILERQNMIVDLIFCLTALAKLDRSQGRAEEAITLAEKSLALSRQCGDPCSTARALQTLGLARYRMGQVDQVRTLFEEGLVVSQACGNRYLAMSALNALGDMACHYGEYEEAQLLFEKCLALSREFDDRYNMALHLNNLGTVLHLNEQYNEAKGYYRESLDICRQIGDLSGQAIALSNLGEIAYTVDAADQALEYYHEALTIGRDVQDQWTILACLNNLGETAAALEDWDSVRVYLAEGLSLAYRTQTVAMLFRILVNLAVLFVRLGQGERAAALLELTCRHPASEQDIKAKAERLLDELGLDPPAGEAVSLDAVVNETLNELSPATTNE